MRSRDIIKKIKAEGWELVRVNGSHHHFRHKTRSGTVTVPHPKQEIPTGTLLNIEKQSGVRLK